MQEGRRINGPAAWRYRIGGTGREISMLGKQCKERFSDIFQQLALAYSRDLHFLPPKFGLEYLRHGRALLAQNRTVGILLRRSAEGQENGVGRGQESGSAPKPGPNETRRAPDPLPHRGRKERRRHRYRTFRGQLKSQESQSGTSGWKALAQACDACGNQGKQALRRFASSSAGKALRSAPNARAIRLSNCLVKAPKSHFV
jgi:hypothetical protein